MGPEICVSQLEQSTFPAPAMAAWSLIDLVG